VEPGGGKIPFGKRPGDLRGRYLPDRLLSRFQNPVVFETGSKAAVPKFPFFGTVSLKFEMVFVVCRIFSVNVTNGEI
jgi:hypothetical protein